MRTDSLATFRIVIFMCSSRHAQASEIQLFTFLCSPKFEEKMAYKPCIYYGYYPDNFYNIIVNYPSARRNPSLLQRKLFVRKSGLKRKGEGKNCTSCSTLCLISTSIKIFGATKVEELL